jgi:RNA polymerase sigma factor (sigma-70 family)
MLTSTNTTVQTWSDEEILELFKVESSKEKVFTYLVKQSQERIYWHIRRLVVHHEDANDVMQNVFIKVWKGLLNFRGDSTLFTWLYRIATNESYTYLESQKKKRSASLSDHESGLSNKIKSEKGFDFNKLEWKLQLAIQSLPPKQQAVFNLRYYDEMPYEQMSEILDSSVGSLKASYHHAAKKVESFILKEN